MRLKKNREYDTVLGVKLKGFLTRHGQCCTIPATHLHRNGIVGIHAANRWLIRVVLQPRVLKGCLLGEVVNVETGTRTNRLIEKTTRRRGRDVTLLCKCNKK